MRTGDEELMTEDLKEQGKEVREDRRLRGGKEDREVQENAKVKGASGCNPAAPRLSGLAQACEDVVELDVHRLAANFCEDQTSAVPGWDSHCWCRQRRCEPKATAIQTVQRNEGAAPAD